MVTLHFVLASIASSYLALGIFDAAKARELWWEYAIVVFCFTVADIICCRRAES